MSHVRIADSPSCLFLRRARRAAAPGRALGVVAAMGVEAPLPAPAAQRTHDTGRRRGGGRGAADATANQGVVGCVWVCNAVVCSVHVQVPGPPGVRAAMVDPNTEPPSDPTVWSNTEAAAACTCAGGVRGGRSVKSNTGSTSASKRHTPHAPGHSIPTNNRTHPGMSECTDSW
jgi:hypothetical protein